MPHLPQLWTRMPGAVRSQQVLLLVSGGGFGLVLAIENHWSFSGVSGGGFGIEGWFGSENLVTSKRSCARVSGAEKV